MHVRIITSADNEVGLKAEYMVRVEYWRMSGMFIGHLISTVSSKVETNSMIVSIRTSGQTDTGIQKGPWLLDHQLIHLLFRRINYVCLDLERVSWRTRSNF